MYSCYFHTGDFTKKYNAEETKFVCEMQTVELKDVENSESSSEDTWSGTEEQEEDINWDWEDETGELT